MFDNAFLGQVPIVGQRWRPGASKRQKRRMRRKRPDWSRIRPEPLPAPEPLPVPEPLPAPEPFMLPRDTSWTQMVQERYPAGVTPVTPDRPAPAIRGNYLPSLKGGYSPWW